MSLVHRLRFFLRKFDLGFRPGDLVLDVGSGNDPHPRADLLCDKFVLDDSEREGRLVVDRPLIGGDLEALPLKSQSIDFVIASHVLEHVKDPAVAIAELQRVAKRGYIETPAEFGGKLMDLPGHRWYVREEAGTLVFTGKSKGMFDDHLNGVCFGLWHQDKGYMQFFWNHLDLFFVRHRWEGRISHRVEPLAGELFEPETFFHSNVSEAGTTKATGASLKTRLKDGIRRYYQSPLYGPKRPVALRDLCACPRCHSPLEFEEHQVSCGACRLTFPMAKQGEASVPMLLMDFVQQPVHS